MRITEHPILDFQRRQGLTIYLEGRPIPARAGEPIAASLHAAGVTTLSHSLRFQRPRGLFCAIGKCASCMMEVDGLPNVRTCIVPVRDGMQLRYQRNSVVTAGASSCPPLRPIRQKKTRLAVIGAGPAGLSAAIYAARQGIEPLLIEEHFLPGGQLTKQTHKFFGSSSHYAGVRGIRIAEELIKTATELGVETWTSASVVGIYPGHRLMVIHQGEIVDVQADTVIVATGASEKNLTFPGNDIPGVYGAGAIQTLMNLYGIKPGKRVLMIGAGNIGVIVAYQLLQAGIQVAAVVEAAPDVGAYRVHSAKLRRLGVPILTRHTIRRVWGGERVEGAEIAAVDERWHPVPGSEIRFDLDTVGLAVGLTPSIEIASQAGALQCNIGEFGGYVNLHDENMQTSVPGLYVAGDNAGIEEASAAMMEGRIAGLSAAERILGPKPTLTSLRAEVRQELAELRDGHFGLRIRQGNQKMAMEAKQNGLL